MLGAIGGTLAVLGVIVLPITSGDTAFRSARMIIAEYLNLAQKKMSSRLWIAVPLFAISVVLTQIDFNILWRYFSWANQATAVIALFVGAMYLYIAKKELLDFINSWNIHALHGYYVYPECSNWFQITDEYCMVRWFYRNNHPCRIILPSS